MYGCQDSFVAHVHCCFGHPGQVAMIFEQHAGCCSLVVLRWLFLVPLGRWWTLLFVLFLMGQPGNTGLGSSAGCAQVSPVLYMLCDMATHCYSNAPCISATELG